MHALLPALLLIPFAEARSALADLRASGWDRERALSLAAQPVLAGLGLELDDADDDPAVPSDADLVLNVLDLLWDAPPAVVEEAGAEPLDLIEDRYHALPWAQLVGLADDLVASGVPTNEAVAAVAELVHQAMPLEIDGPSTTHALLEQAERSAVSTGLRLLLETSGADPEGREARRSVRRVVRQSRRDRRAARRRRRLKLQSPGAASPFEGDSTAAHAAAGQ